MIKSMDFCRIVSDKKVKGSGLRMGDLVLVTGTSLVPASKKDPYLQRTLTTVIKVKGDQLLMPKQNNDEMAYLLDPRSLEKVNDKDQETLTDNIKKQFGG